MLKKIWERPVVSGMIIWALMSVGVVFVVLSTRIMSIDISNHIEAIVAIYVEWVLLISVMVSFRLLRLWGTSTNVVLQRSKEFYKNWLIGSGVCGVLWSGVMLRILSVMN